jgi:hypothetical protein
MLRARANGRIRQKEERRRPGVTRPLALRGFSRPSRRCRAARPA